MAATVDLKSTVLGRAGSNPALGTKVVQYEFESLEGYYRKI
jgi:hypothetical protein